MDVFISYSHEDTAYARRLESVLAEGGLSVWLDRDLTVGLTFDDLVQSALVEARVFVVCGENL